MIEIPSGAESDGPFATTTVTSFRVIETLKQRGQAGVTELADDLDLAKGTVHKHLTTLLELGYVVREGTDYRLSLALLGIGSSVRAGMEIYEAAYEPIRRLAETTGETASVMVAEHGYGVYLTRVNTAGDPPTELREGERVPMHATAGGKAILAYMPEDERDAILDCHGLAAHTEETITDRDALETVLESVYDRRMAEDQGEFDPKIHCLAMPVTDPTDRAVAAITLSGEADDVAEKSQKMKSVLGSTANLIRARIFE